MTTPSSEASAKGGIHSQDYLFLMIVSVVVAYGAMYLIRALF